MFSKNRKAKPASQSYPLKDLPVLPALPEMPDYFQHEWLQMEFEDFKPTSHESRYTVGRYIWNVWHFFLRMKIATLFIYKFIDSPNIATLYKDYPDLEIKIKLAASTIHLPTVFLPGNTSQTPTIVFAEPSKTFLLQYLVTSNIKMDVLAHCVDNVFKLDANNVLTVADADLFHEFIRGLTKTYTAIEKAIEDMRPSLLMADTIDYRDNNTYYLRLYKDDLDNNPSIKFIKNTEETGNKLWDDYEEILSLVTSETHNVRETAEEQLFTNLEDFFYGLLVSKIFVFYSVKGLVQFPGDVDYEISSFLEYFESKMSVAQRLRLLPKQLIEEYCEKDILEAETKQIQQLAESSPERIKRTRDMYYKIRHDLYSIFYIFKNVVNRYNIKINQYVRDITDNINELEQFKSALHHKIPSLQSANHFSLIKSLSRQSSESKTPSVDEKAIVLKASVEIPVLRKESCGIYLKYVETSGELEAGIKSFDLLCDKLLKKFGIERRFEEKKSQLQSMKKKWTKDGLNNANRIKGEVSKILSNEEYSLSAQLNIQKWQSDIDKLIKLVTNALRNIQQIENELNSNKKANNKHGRDKKSSSDNGIPSATGIKRSLSDNTKLHSQSIAEDESKQENELLPELPKRSVSSSDLLFDEDEDEDEIETVENLSFTDSPPSLSQVAPSEFEVIAIVGEGVSTLDEIFGKKIICELNGCDLFDEEEIDLQVLADMKLRWERKSEEIEREHIKQVAAEISHLENELHELDVEDMLDARPEFAISRELLNCENKFVYRNLYVFFPDVQYHRLINGAGVKDTGLASEGSPRSKITVKW